MLTTLLLTAASVVTFGIATEKFTYNDILNTAMNAGFITKTPLVVKDGGETKRGLLELEPSAPAAPPGNAPAAALLRSAGVLTSGIGDTGRRRLLASQFRPASGQSQSHDHLGVASATSNSNSALDKRVSPVLIRRPAPVEGAPFKNQWGSRNGKIGNLQGVDYTQQKYNSFIVAFDDGRSESFPTTWCWHQDKSSVQPGQPVLIHQPAEADQWVETNQAWNGHIGRLRGRNPDDTLIVDFANDFENLPDGASRASDTFLSSSIWSPY